MDPQNQLGATAVPQRALGARPQSPSGLSERLDPGVVWTGAELIVAGSRPAGLDEPFGAIFHWGTLTWTLLPPASHGSALAGAASLGDVVYVSSSYLDESTSLIEITAPDG